MFLRGELLAMIVLVCLVEVWCVSRRENNVDKLGEIVSEQIFVNYQLNREIKPKC